MEQREHLLFFSSTIDGGLLRAEPPMLRASFCAARSAPSGIDRAGRRGRDGSGREHAEERAVEIRWLSRKPRWMASARALKRPGLRSCSGAAARSAPSTGVDQPRARWSSARRRRRRSRVRCSRAATRRAGSGRAGPRRAGRRAVTASGDHAGDAPSPTSASMRAQVAHVLERDPGVETGARLLGTAVDR